jgi:hypothetical protein
VQLAGGAGLGHQAGDQRHTALAAVAGQDGGERDQTLAEQVVGTVGLVGVVEADRRPGRLVAAARHQRIAEDDEAPGHRELPAEQRAQGVDQGQPAQLAALDHPVVGLPAAPRHDGQ